MNQNEITKSAMRDLRVGTLLTFIAINLRFVSGISLTPSFSLISCSQKTLTVGLIYMHQVYRIYGVTW